LALAEGKKKEKKVAFPSAEGKKREGVGKTEFYNLGEKKRKRKEGRLVSPYRCRRRKKT